MLRAAGYFIRRKDKRAGGLQDRPLIKPDAGIMVATAAVMSGQSANISPTCISPVQRASLRL